MRRLIDANVVLRILLGDTEHPKFPIAIEYLETGGVICDYVFPEVAYQFLGRYKSRMAKDYAIEHEQLPQYYENPRNYAQSIQYPAGYRKCACAALRDGMNQFLSDYPNIVIDQKEHYDAAMNIACVTGHDWVDCMLLAEKALKGDEVYSLDKDLTTVIDPAQVLGGAKPKEKAATTANSPQPEESSEPEQEPEAVACSSAPDEGKKGKGVSKMSLR